MNDNKFSLAHRILHWSLAIAILFLLLTILLRMGWMNKNHMADILKENLSEINIQISDDQAVVIAKKIRQPMWQWHIYTGYAIVVIYFLRGLLALFQGWLFANPFESITDVYKEVITYKRNDGVTLTGTLYLPAGYDRKSKTEKLPLLIWAYPTEYKDKNTAGQNTQNPNDFTFPYYGSFVYWTTKGYAVLDDAAFPIIGEGKTEPNDTFIPQLVANAEAAIKAVDQLGYIDRKKVAVGGHSYGAFMTANLLAHTDLFKAGIARSGAYNRTLTPFGFQNEDRTYWQAPQLYYEMSPFSFADKIKEPILLVHGEQDDNTGTFPINSERLYAALKGNGATTRFVYLPYEAHSYRGRENVLHLLWEQFQWLEKYLK